MNNPSVEPSPPNPIEASETSPTASPIASEPAASPQPKPSYVKLAMRNMVRKRGTSLYHFALTTVGLVAVLVGLAYLTR